MTTETVTSFDQLALSQPILKVLDDVGYEIPSPIQAKTIPLIAQGRDVLGQAQTGTGKTAAFALPILSRLELKQKDPQVLVLAPTRELAIQVAEAFQKYARHLKGFHVLPVYGGQDYRGQIRALNRGVHVVVGTPGRVMDHMRKGTLKLDKLKTLVLDEADEMLRMGFIDDVEWILDQIPEQRQIALFSATMPQQIRRIASKYLTDPEQVTIKVKTTTADTIRQRFWMVKGVHKLDALTRILEAEPFDAMIVFVRTKTATAELSDKLQARGYESAPLNGDIAQNQRERTISQLKNGKLDILVATDVAARGLDVPRISHVINYDIPYDTEAYVHRIGRTGRAGKDGDAILFVAPRERRLLFAIEKATRKKIDLMELPSTKEVNDRRITRFKQRIRDTLETEQLDFFVKLVEEFKLEHEIPVEKVAAALAHLSQGDNPLLLQARPQVKSEKFRDDNRSTGNKRERGERIERRSRGDERNDRGERPFRKDGPPEKGMERFRVEVGREHGVKPGNIVGAIANEAGVDGEHIGRINIQDDFSLVDLPEGMPKDIFNDLKNVRVAGQKLGISRLEQARKKHFSHSKGKGGGGGHKAHKGNAGRSKHRKGPKRN
ncbi:MAG: DEAD/DEAH box helicase [Proteobacteria bacterium]|nr:DEAD/DEAH box helicase [Pseudomonadota bacterium]